MAGRGAGQGESERTGVMRPPPIVVREETVTVRRFEPIDLTDRLVVHFAPYGAHVLASVYDRHADAGHALERGQGTDAQSALADVLATLRGLHEAIGSALERFGAGS